MLISSFPFATITCHQPHFSPKDTRQPTFPSSDLVKQSQPNETNATVSSTLFSVPDDTVPALCPYRTGPPRQFKLAPFGTIYISILHVPPSPLFASQLYSLSSSLFSLLFFLLLLPIYSSPTTSSSSSLSFVTHVIPRGQFCGSLEYRRLTAHHGQTIQITDKRLPKPPP
ncbi:hypothetical protein V8C43DRAFT_320369 [Trichoderma afarasin]